MRIRKSAATLLLASVALASTVASPSFAQDETVATVDGEPITSRDVDMALEAFGSALEQIPQEQRREAVADLLVDMALIAAAAEREGLAETEAFKERLAFLRRQALRDAYFETRIDAAVSEDEVRTRYEQEVAQIPPRQEVRARHILVEDEEEAKRLIEEIKSGTPFEDVAREHSKDPGSGARGGDLGFFGEGQMVPAFERAAFTLYPGEITDEPVQTRFGWHIIKKEEVRETPPPSFENVKDQVREIIVREKFLEKLEELRAEAEIVRPGSAE